MLKNSLVLLLLIVASQCIAQGVSKNGQVTSNPVNFVNRNGAIGTGGLTRSGANYTAIPAGSSNGFHFDGVDDYLTVPPAVYFNGNFTIECWVYPNSFGNWARIIDFGNGAGSNNVLLGYTYGTSGAPGFYVGGAQMQASQTLVLNQWNHVAATLNGTTATIYVNGIAAGTATFPVPANITRNLCYIGKSNWGGDPNAHGVYDELRIWNVAKTPAEIQASMYNELAGTEPGLVAYYNFNHGTAGGVNTGITILADATANAGNGTLQNAALSGSTSNWVSGAPLLYDGSSALTASTSAYAIKQAYPAAASGLYWIKNSNINGGTPFQVYADMTTDGGGWTLVMCNKSPNTGWTNASALLRNQNSPAINDNYSIIAWADYLKKSSSGFQYMMDAQTRGANGGIWTANSNYSFVSTANTNTNITLNTKFGTWNYSDSDIEARMPWYAPGNPGLITTSTSASGSWWGTLIASGGWDPAPWLGSSVQNPGIIWYWVR